MDNGLSEYSFETFDAEIAHLRQVEAGNADRLALLDRIQQWRDGIQATL